MMCGSGALQYGGAGPVPLPITATLRKTMSMDNETPKKHYESPILEEHGRIEDLTGWVGGPWGEFLGGPVTGYNPVVRPGELIHDKNEPQKD